MANQKKIIVYDVWAEKFMRESGGKLAQFEEAMKAAYEDLYEDTKMVRQKRKMKKIEKLH